MKSTLEQSYKTATSRKKLSAPCTYLKEHGLLIGKLLDYGCGRGTDADLLGADKYDPHYFPLSATIQPSSYDTIYCNYVLNVIEAEEIRNLVMTNILRFLKVGGKAYITVRRDKKRLIGRTSKGTWQGYITLPLSVIYEKKGKFITYGLTKIEYA